MSLAAGEERSALHALMQLYFSSLDNRRWDDLANCFAQDAEFGMSGKPPDGADAMWLRGREEIVKNVRYLERWRCSTHTHANSAFAVDGATATGTTHATAVLIEETTTGELAQIRGLKYVDEFTRQDGTWRIQRHTHIPTWQFTADAESPSRGPAEDS